MKKINVLYDATCICDILTKDSSRSGIFFVAYNVLLELLKREKFNVYLYTEISIGRNVKNMTITKDSIIGDILDAYGEVTAPFFLEMGMHCLGCPASRGETVAQACDVHGVDADELVKKLNEAVGN